MHNNYYFLKHLSGVLHQKLKGFELRACFSQHKNELVFAFVNKTSEFFIKAHLDPAFCCLSFPDNFSRARKNSADLFEELLYKKVIEVQQFENERCFAINFDDDHRLLFKMHGNRSNIILYKNSNIAHVFKKSLIKDLDLEIESLTRKIDQSYKAFIEHDGDYKLLFPTFGKVILTYLEQKGLKTQDLDGKWQLIQHTIEQLNHPQFYITMLEGKLQFSMLKVGAVQKTLEDPIAALNTFFIQFISEASLNALKQEMLGGINRQLKQSRNYIKKAASKLEEIEQRTDYSNLADILMANLHRIPPKVEAVTLENFYNNNLPVKISLKRDLSPQKNAENYYRKSKNQAVEIKNLKDNLDKKKQDVAVLEAQKETIDHESDLRMLRKLRKSEAPLQKKERRPFNTFESNGYVIWVGKNARSNDEMLQQYSFKDDLWLHAKEVTGSHVLLKHQAGKNFPKDVIEKAAQLAAYYSKRRTDSLCPVIATARKFVRKRKGDPAGAVVVDKEEQIILVKPENQI